MRGAGVANEMEFSFDDWNFKTKPTQRPISQRFYVLAPVNLTRTQRHVDMNAMMNILPAYASSRDWESCMLNL